MTYQDIIIPKKHIEHLKAQRNETLVFKHSTHPYNMYLLSQLYEETNKNIFVVLPNLYEAQQYYDHLQKVMDANNILFYPVDQTLTYLMALGSPEFKTERLFTTYQLLSGKSFVVITTHQGISRSTLSVNDYEQAKTTLLINNNYPKEDVLQYLVYNGYQNVHTVEKPGDFSTRGNIIDFYSLQYEHPVRLDFFGKTLETIKFFELDTQRSIAKLYQIDIVPVNELFYTDAMKEKLIEKLEKDLTKDNVSEKEHKKLTTDIDYLNTRQHLERLDIYVHAMNKKTSTITEFSEDHYIVMIDVHKMMLNEQQKTSELQTYEHAMGGQYFLNLVKEKTLEDVLKSTHIKLYTQHTEDDGMSFNIEEVPLYQQNIQLLIHDIKTTPNIKDIIISLPTKALKDVFLDQANALIENYPVTFTDDYMIGSFYDANLQRMYLDETTIFNKQKTIRSSYRSVMNQTSKIHSTDDLSLGDYVVHYDYGIGQYIGIKTMELGLKKRDYLHLIYANEEALYVPMDQMDRVLKYSQKDSATPKLSKLGSKIWTQTKASVKQKIKDLSDRLISIYAEREHVTRQKFEYVEDLETSFALDFPYEPTPDQQKAIIETLYDMEGEKPMDRLICGDVGFGKTEVALRAAFRAVTNAKQVIVLVPTTVLARQHYHTFKERFEKYGASVGILSRFVTQKEQKQYIENFKKGLLDVLIGTHRVLSKDIIPKDLGLLVVDEEQRFGVEQKEIIREIKKSVDTLTMSATPIPRTLQMSLMGLKDMSMIETPPKNRYPVQTYLVERNEALVKEAIEREIARGGQIFYLFNRVSGMTGMLQKLKKLVPNARIAFAHGKLHREELEEVLTNFIEHEYDVLISTTIIETGIDIPNTNTLIIHDADKLGLSQLYQIRGRVGRSDRIAYAYLFYEQYLTINDEARKRLQAIQDFTALGSGYKIALRDLAIRGAGDILGQEQSGFIDTVGYELYMKLVEEAMTGKKAFDDLDPKDNEAYAARHVDPQYANYDTLRIEIHKRIATLHTLEDVETLKEELTDRFGPIDGELRQYMYEKLFKKLSNKLNVIQVSQTPTYIKFTFHKDVGDIYNTQPFMQTVRKFQAPSSLDFERGHIVLKMEHYQKNEHWLYLACQLFETLLPYQLAVL